MIHVLFEIEMEGFTKESENFVCAWSFTPSIADLCEVIQKEDSNLDKETAKSVAKILLSQGDVDVSDYIYRLYELNDGEIL